MADSPDPFGNRAELDSAQAHHLTSDDERNEKKVLNKAKRDTKKAKRAAAKAAEEANYQAGKEARRKRNEALKVKVIDGNVVDESGRVIRPYSRAEQFFDNKVLVYALLIVFILVCLIATIMLMY
jgi:FKBP-type peptidyl-prolyl cis-trans isomerase